MIIKYHIFFQNAVKYYKATVINPKTKAVVCEYQHESRDLVRRWARRYQND